MKGTEYRDATQGITNVIASKHARPETAHKAIGRVLAYLGARRIQVLSDGGPEGAADRRIISMLVEAEQAAGHLDAIPQRAEHTERRRATWDSIVESLGLVKLLLERERATTDAMERITAAAEAKTASA